MSNNALNCAVCGSMAKMMCQRCHEPYCSTACQATDWRRHKNKCFQMPLVSVDDTVEAEIALFPNNWCNSYTPPSGDFFDVVVQHVDASAGSQNLLAWLMEIKQQPKLTELLEMLKRQVRFQTVCSKDQLRVNELVVVAIKENYYRAKILAISMHSEEVKVFLIDYGKKIELNCSQIYPANNNLAAVPALAFGAIIANATPQTLQCKELSIKLNSNVPNKDGYYLAQLQNAPTAAETNTKIVHVQVLTTQDSAERYVMLQQYQRAQFYDKLESKLQCITHKTNAACQEGDIVAAYVQDMWQRAFVLSLKIVQDFHLVYLLDKGNMSFCHKLSPLPTDYQEIPPAILIVHLLLPLKEQLFNARGELHFNTCDCLLKVSNFQSAGRMLTSQQFFNDEEYDYWREKIANGSHVRITNYISLSELWVNVSDVQQLRQIISGEAINCKSVSMQTKLNCNRLVVAPLPGSQSGYMRATILAVQQDKFEVCDVDTGVSSLVPRNKLRHPTALIRALPSKVTYICLDMLNELDIPITASVECFYKKCIAEQVEFELQLTEEQSTKQLANLKFVNENNKVLSKVVLPMLYQSQEKQTSNAEAMRMPVITKVESVINVEELQKPNQQAHMENDDNMLGLQLEEPKINKKIVNEPKEQAQSIKINLDVERLPLQEGDNVKLFVIDSAEIDENLLTVVPFNNGKTLQTMQEQREMVLKYCEKVPTSSRGYIPRKNELCLAIYQEDAEWYRARCLEVHSGNVFTVQFIDYGNTSEVPMKDLIGPLPKELQFPQFAHICLLQDVKDKTVLVNKITANPILTCKVLKKGTAYYITP